MDPKNRLPQNQPPGGPDTGERIVMPVTQDASGRVTIHPEALEVTPVDEELFRRITAGDAFIGGECPRCSCHEALFVCAGRFVGLCPWCAVLRIQLLREKGAPEPKWITVLYEEAAVEAVHQRCEAERALTVEWNDIYKCARCGHLLTAEEARYWHPPGENTSPPYCRPCADQLRGGRAP